MRKVLKSKSGFTLVELTVAFVLLCVLISITGSVIISSLGVYSKSAAAANAQYVCDSVYDFLCDRMTYAQNIEIGSDENGYPKSITVADGMAYYRASSDSRYVLIIDESSYRSSTVSIKTEVDGALMTLTVTVKYGERKIVTRSSSFRLINIEKMESASVVGTTEEVNNPMIFFS